MRVTRPLSQRARTIFDALVAALADRPARIELIRVSGF
jgi:hypothetical protein